MASWIPTADDRNEAGRIAAPGFDDERAAPAPRATSPHAHRSLDLPLADEPPAQAPTAPWAPREIALTIGSVLLVLAALAALIVTARPDAASRPLATVPPPAISATVADLPLPTTGTGLPRAIVAYAAPGVEPLGAIEAGRAYTPTAVYSAAWVRLDVAGSGLVWVRSQDLPEVSRSELADLAPPPTPTPPPPLSAPPAVAAPVAPAACDPVTGPYRVTRVFAYGSVTGVSCVSEAEAIENADRLAADLAAVATATAGARATPTVPPAEMRGER